VSPEILNSKLNSIHIIAPRLSSCNIPTKILRTPMGIWEKFGEMDDLPEVLPDVFNKSLIYFSSST
jgi:hypothetical protein